MANLKLKDVLERALGATKSYVDGLLDNKSDLNHTHNYAGSSSVGGTANSVNGFSFWVGTQAQYDALSTKSNTTVYMIKDN